MDPMEHPLNAEVDSDVETDTGSGPPSAVSSNDVEEDWLLPRRPFYPVEVVRRPQAPVLEALKPMGKKESQTKFNADQDVQGSEEDEDVDEDMEEDAERETDNGSEAGDVQMGEGGV